MKTSHLFKRLLSLALAFVMLLGMLPAPQARAAGDGTTLYLKPNDNWRMDGAWFAMYYFGDSGSGWSGMADSDGDGVYEGTVPDGYGNVIFCRMDPGKSELDWGSKWNQTADLTVPGDGTNCYTVEPGSWDSGNGTWSVYPEKEEKPSEVPSETPTTAPVVPPESEGEEEDAFYTVAGNGSLCGSDWKPEDTANRMEKNEDGLYVKVYANVPAGTYSLKVTDGTWNNSWGENGQNYTFVVSATCDVTVTFDPATYTVTVTGDHVGRENGLEITSMAAVGNGSGAWLNGVSWNPGSALNFMTEVSDNVYEITYKNVPAGSAYEFKFAANGSWDHSWGYGASYGEAVYNSQTNIKLVVEYALADVSLRIDMNGYDHETKLGATYSVTVTEVAAEPEVEYYMVGYINGTDYGCNDDWENLGQYKFVDGKLTAKFDQDSYVFLKTGDNASWFMFETYVDAASGTLYNTANGTSEKMRVPGGVELEFTLVVNEDGSLTLSYAEVADTNDVTIHFFKPEDWGTNINAYLWVTGGAIPGYEEYNAWPGKAVNVNADHAGWYDLVVSTAAPLAFNFIFNDGGKQTADLFTGDITGDTELWVVGSTVSTTAPGEWSGDYDYTAHLHFRKLEGWGETINAYLWTDNGAIPGYEAYNAWPGAAVEADPINAGWYNLSVTMDGSEGFSYIFNDGNGNQTADLVTGELEVNTHLWIVDGAASDTMPDGWKDPNRTIHVPGTFPGPSWDAASNTMTYDPELGLYVYTFKDVPAANYEYKISINGSWNENYGAAGVRDGANMAVAVPETMDVTVYYNDDTHFSVTSITYIFADVLLTGTGIPEGTKLTDKGLSGIYSVTVPMTAGTYIDLVITCNGNAYPFSEIEIEEDKNVTFYMDPVTEIYYCDASDIPVDTKSIYFDSQNEAYKKPFGAVATGEDVTFAIDTGKDVTSAVLVVKGLGSYPMTGEETETGKRWSTGVSFASIGEYDYYFSLSNGSSVVIYSDDDGYYGEGTVTELSNVKAYDLVVYKSGFRTPDWMKDAVIYQIFPDRFFDGDISNNQAQTSARGAVNYEYINDWYVLPENPEQEAMLDEAIYKSTGAHFGDGEWSNEIYGGDLDGITQRIGYLKALGVNVIYLNPIFASISNHRYDACDYTEIDPILGTMGDFKELVAAAEANGMHIILDGVFNHVSDDSVYFDRYYKFLGKSEKIGAYPYWAYVYDYMADNGTDRQTAEEAARSYFGTEYGITDYSYTEWFEVYSTASASVDTIGLRVGKPVYSYDGWWGYDSMPIIYSTNGSEYQTGNWAEEIIYNGNGNSVTQYWISKGNNGWRLDVANEVSDETWQRFRDSVKAMDSEAVIIGEIWDDATKYLKGDMYDSVMNYQFRNAVTSFAMGTGSDQTTRQMEKIRERYPEEAFYAMMNLVGSHDTTRILSYLDGIGDDRADKSLDAAFPTYAKTSAAAKARQYLVAFLQFTYAGAPTIYYGDEIGMVGSDDPDDRRAMEWGRGNKELVEWYATLAAVRDAYPALRTGDVSPVDLDNDSLLAFVRADGNNTITVIANNSASEQTAALEGTYVDVLTGKTFDGSVTVPARNGLILVAAEEAKSISINAAALAPAYDSAYTVAIRPEGVHVHSYEAVVTAPTCTEEGYTTYTCTGCDDSYVSNEVPALGHAYETVVTAPTCTDEGYTTYTCSACGYSYTDNTVAALGHTWDDGVVTAEPSKDAPGEVTYTCVVCGETYTEKLIIGLAATVSDKVTAGKSMTLKATDLRTGKAVAASKVVWSLADEADEAYASLTANGNLKTYKTGEKATIVVIGRLKNEENVRAIRHTITIYPAATGVSVNLVEGSGDVKVLTDISGTTRTLDVSGASEDALPGLSLAARVYPADGRQEVTWKSSNPKIASVDETGKVSAVWDAKKGICKTGTVTITATATDGTGKKASFKLKLTSLVSEIEIVTKDGKNMGLLDLNGTGEAKPVIFATAGKSLNLKANVNADATNKAVTWQTESGYAKINASGKLTISKDVPNQSIFKVTALAKDGSGTVAEISVLVKPAATNVHIFANGTYVSNTTKTWNMSAQGNETLRLSAKVYPRDAAQEVTWKSSNAKIAKIETDENGSTILRFLKAGNVTITATANDGSREKASFKLKVVKGVTSLTLENQSVVGGKTLNLAKLVTINPKDATTKTLKWELLDNDCGATITKTGMLKTKAVKEPTEVTVIVSSTDGWGATPVICTVTILPKT